MVKYLCKGASKYERKFKASRLKKASNLKYAIRLIHANQTYKCEPDKMQVNVDEVRLPKTRVRYSAHIALR